MNITDANSFSDEGKKQLGHDLKDILIECWFNDKPCNSTDFTWSFHNIYGNCYKFNTGFDVKSSTLAGPDHGLSLTLYVNIYEKLLKKRSLYSLGAIVQIGNGSYSMYHANNGVFISPSTNAYISIEREFKSMLPKPYSNCEVEPNSSKFNSDLYNLIDQSDYDYTQQLCFSQCLQRKFIEKYNCSLHYLLSLYNNKSQCNPGIVDMIYSNNDSFDANFINEVCLPLCPLECNQILYKKSYSSNQFNGNDYYVHYLRNNLNLASDFINRTIDSAIARDGILNVNIFYSSLSYVQTKESPQMDIVSLLSSIGGNLGLFLEVSLLSLCEITQVVIEIFYAYINPRKYK